MPTAQPPCKCRDYRDGDREIALVRIVYHRFSCWYCWSLLRSVWLPVWLIHTEVTGAMVATEAAMVVDMGAMVDIASATAVTEHMVATMVVIEAERHPGILLTIDIPFHSPEFVLFGALMQVSNITWNCLHSEQPWKLSFYRWSDGDIMKLRHQFNHLME